MTLPWFLFYGMHLFHMTRQEVLNTRYGEFVDLLSCLAVYNGAAKEKPKKLSFDEALLLR